MRFDFLSVPINSGKVPISTIVRFDPAKDIYPEEKSGRSGWTKLGDLNVARHGHSVIQAGNKFIVVGGTTTRCGAHRCMIPNTQLPTESCKLDGQSMTCVTREPKLSTFTYWPLLMFIP